MSGASFAAAIELAFQLHAAAQKISARVMAAQAEGRDRLTDDEWTDIKAENDESRARWVDAIERKEDTGGTG